ncbi:MAG: serine acetyltransferase [Anaerolineales bacterium]|nr:serine acetyltransferase [Anaerolineales bacterium]
MRAMRALPQIVLFKRSSRRAVIEADVKRWMEIRRPERANRSANENVTWLLETFPEFRNLLYFRLGEYDGIPGKLLLALARFFFPPMETPGFAFCDIGPGLFIEYGYGTIIGPRKMGENCRIAAGVTIGYKNDSDPSPVIGNNVFIGAGAQVLGPITIGDNVIIGANAVVLRDVPPNCTVAGVPARIIKRDGERVKRFSADSH